MRPKPPRGPGTSLAPEDVARLHMGTPRNPMVITAALVLDGPMRHEVLLGLVRERLLAHERFRQRVAEPRFGLGIPRWVDEPELELAHHVPAVRLPENGTIEDLIGELVSTPLDRNRPLWQLVHVEGVPGGDVLVVRVQHCVADGLGLITVLAGIADGATPDLTVHPRRVRRRRLSLSGRVVRIVKALSSAGRLALTHAEPRNLLRARLGVRKEAAVSHALSLDALLHAAHVEGTTLNGLLLAAVTEALRSQLRGHGGRDDVGIHALVPMSLPPGPDPSVGNRYASVFVPLPMALPDRESRVKRLQEDLAALRTRGAASAGSHLASAAGAATAFVERVGVGLFSRRATVMVSDVRGPVDPVRLGGVGVRDIFVWAPAPGSLPLAVSLISYAGRVRVGVLADAKVIGDARPIARDIERELSLRCDGA